LQTWVALPAAYEETDPSFAHYEETDLPVLETEGKCVRVVIGQAWGLHSPVVTVSDMIYADVRLEPGAVLPLDAAHEERAVYVVSGAVNIGGDRFPSGQLLVLRPDTITLHNADDATTRLVLVGGETMDGPRHIWWNFVSSRPDRIEQGNPCTTGAAACSPRPIIAPIRTSAFPMLSLLPVLSVCDLV
jgi:redox-sensitive bicupin YhaK (pirin superfamily)